MEGREKSIDIYVMVKKVAYFPEVKPSGVVSRATKERGKQRNEVLPRENKPFLPWHTLFFSIFTTFVSNPC